MKILLKLYPPAWRRRYEAELAALLDEERAGTRGALDLIRGAADAWIIGPRGPFGGLEVWLAAVAYLVASVAIAAGRRLLGPDGPWENLLMVMFWVLFIVFTTWLSRNPAARCDMGWITRRRPGA